MKALLNKKNLISAAAILIVYVFIQLLINVNIIDPYVMINLVVICINIVLALGLNLITGITGQFSLGHAGFMAVGAYTSAVITAKFGMPFIVGILGAAVLAAAVGLLIGIPVLRLKGDYLAIATLGFAEIIRILLLNFDYVGGASGFNDIPQYTNWTWIYAVVIITYVFIKNFINSDYGRACMSVREDEIAAEAMGVNTTFYKVLAFVIGAMFAGIGGALYANYYYVITPGVFNFNKSIDILVIVVLGGLGSLEGSILGAVLLTVVSTFLQRAEELRMVIYAVVLFIIMVYRPQGLLGKGGFKLKFLSKGGHLNGTAQDK